jgi:hypothetical protein
MKRPSGRTSTRCTASRWPWSRSGPTPTCSAARSGWPANTTSSTDCLHRISGLELGQVLGREAEIGRRDVLGQVGEGAGAGNGHCGR